MGHLPANLAGALVFASRQLVTPIDPRVKGENNIDLVRQKVLRPKTQQLKLPRLIFL
jgi:hypothetical protein